MREEIDSTVVYASARVCVCAYVPTVVHRRRIIANLPCLRMKRKRTVFFFFFFRGDDDDGGRVGVVRRRAVKRNEETGS